MKNVNRKLLVLVLALGCMAPAALARVRRPRHSVPEGGSSIVYLLGAGIACAGAMTIRHRTARPNQA
jgi:hypothetical protein